MIFILFLYVHVIGCLWFYVAREEKTWVPLKDAIFEDQFSYELYVAHFERQYLIVFYTAYYLISSGEMKPTTNIEFIVAFVIMIISSMILANIFG